MSPTHNEKIIEIITNYSNVFPDKIDDQINLYDVFGIDSIDSIQIQMIIEEDFDIEFDDDFHPKTIGDFINQTEFELLKKHEDNNRGKI